MRGKRTKKKETSRSVKVDAYPREAGEVNALHERIITRDKDSLADAIRAGEILCKVKESLEHGAFQRWCKAHIHRVGARTVRLYMQISHAHAAGAIKSAKTLTDAILSIRVKKTIRKEKADASEPGPAIAQTPVVAVVSHGPAPDAGRACATPPTMPKVCAAHNRGLLDAKACANRTTKAGSSIVAEAPDECVVLEVVFRDAADLKQVLCEALDDHAVELLKTGRFLIAGMVNADSEPYGSVNELLKQASL